jgi:nucleoside-diphosphate-sugar epimerase
MKTVLITGGLGHIGSQLIRDLPDLLPDTRIRILDNLSTQRYCSLFDLPAHGHYEFIEGDMHGPELDGALAGVDAVVHLAGLTDAAGTAGAPEKVFRENLDGTVGVARRCAALGIPILLASTTSVYGSQSAVVDESCPEEELKPQSPYAASKLAAERVLAELGNAAGLRWVACRFGTIFGAAIGMRFHTAVNKFIWQATLGHPITVWRTALDQKRPYLALEDAVESIAFILREDLFRNEVLNVVTCNATVREITDTIRASIPDLRIEFVDTRIMNQLSYHVLADRLAAYGFTPRGDLARSVQGTIALLAAAGGRTA